MTRSVLAAALVLIAPPIPAAIAQKPVFSSSAVGVRIDAQVTQGKRPVPGLTAADFEVLDNGVPQRVSLVDSDEIPINVVLALDVSGSTQGQRLADLVAASDAIIGGLKTGDRAGLTTFTHVASPRIALTPDVRSISRELREVKADGDTSVMDALYVALMQTQEEAGRSLVIVCTDGRDTSSWLQKDELLESARRSNAVVTFVAAGRARQWPLMKEVADATGGDALDIESTRDLESAFQRILQNFRGRYVISFVPAGVSDSGYHRLEVRARRQGLTVRARPGYFGLPAGGAR